MDGWNPFEGLYVIAVAGLIALPFAIWKVVELIIWIANNVHISIG